VSAVADPGPPPEASGWERLEEAAARAAASLAGWRRRALEAEAEVARLRSALESVAHGAAGEAGGEGEGVALRAENAVLQSRIGEARTRVRGLIARLAVLEARR